MRKTYRIILINNKTNERKMMNTRFTSKKRAIETGSKFCISIGANASYEILTEVK